VQTSDSVLALRAASRGIVNLRAGVTTLRLTSEKNFTDIAVREMFVQGTFPGPRLLTACRGLKPTGGHGVTAVIADGPDEVRRALRENFLRGADHAKLFLTGGVATAGSDPLRSLYTQEEVNAAVEIAHNIGKPIGAHAYGGPGVDYCIAAGMDAIEHGVYVTDEQFARMAEVGCYLVATLGIFLMQPGPAENPSWPADVREKFLRAREAAAESVVRAKKNGVKVALGTDAIHGGAADEIIFAGASGLSNRDAIAGATTVAASLLRRENELGTVRDGAFADLIAVRGDPVKDLRALKQVEFVMASGLPVAA
jgi:imidazolonepropionase-like amidohydrolase